DIASALTLPPPEATYYFCKADIPRGMDVAQLCELALSAGLHGAAHPSVAAAVEDAREAAGPHDLVLVTGSVCVVAEALCPGPPENEKAPVCGALVGPTGFEPVTSCV